MSALVLMNNNFNQFPHHTTPHVKTASYYSGPMNQYSYSPMSHPATVYNYHSTYGTNNQQSNSKHTFSYNTQPPESTNTLPVVSAPAPIAASNYSYPYYPVSHQSPPIQQQQQFVYSQHPQHHQLQQPAINPSVPVAVSTLAAVNSPPSNSTVIVSPPVPVSQPIAIPTVASVNSNQSQSISSSPTDNSPPSTSSGPAPSLQSIFEDLDSRFLINLPDDELKSFDRLFFQLQQAHWFYCDCYQDRWTKLPKFNLKQFCQQFFKFSPLLKSYFNRFESVFQSFNQYLNSVPVCGVILLNNNLTECVMVRGWKGQSWGFPRGKIDENENEVQCAIRECKEEIGFDCSQLIQENQFVEANSRGKSMKLFIIPNVPQNTQFQTQTKKEISAIEWVPLDQLPSHNHSNTNDSESKHKYWNVTPFVDQIKRWIKKQKQGKHKKQTYEHKETLSNAKPTQLKHTKSTPPVPIPANSANSKGNKSSQRHSVKPGYGNSKLDSITFGDDTLVANSANKSSKKLGSSVPNPSGWSAEQMFAENEKLFGLKSTVPEEKLEAPQNIDEIMKQVLGPKQAKKYQQKQLQQQQTNVTPMKSNPNTNNSNNSTASKSGKHAHKKKQHSTLPDSHSNSSSKSRPLHEELDFCHNPTVVHALTNQSQPQQNVINSAADSKPKSSTATHAKSGDANFAFDFNAIAASLSSPEPEVSA